MQKVIYLTNVPSPYKVAFLRELAKYVELTVLYETDCATDRNKNWIDRDPERNETFQEVVLKSIWRGADQAYCPEVKKWLKKDSVIVIDGYSTPTGMAAISFMKRHKIQYWISSDGGMVRNDSPVKRAIKRHFLSGAAGYFSSGKETDRYLIYYGAAEDKICRYPFTSVAKKDVLETPLSNGEKSKLRRKLDMPEDKTVILSVGQFIPRKGFDILLRAAGQRKQEGKAVDEVYYIIGDKPGVEYLKLERELDVNNVKYVDFMAYDQLKEYYRASDVFVLPTREDIWGLVINESLANGLPVITTDRCVAGLEMAQMGNAVRIIHAENVDALACALDHVSELQKEDCIRIAKEFTIEKMAEVYGKVLTER